MSTPMLRDARFYLSLGWSIIPVRERDKTPLIDWKSYSNRRATEAEVTRWWTQSPNANIGIVTGAVSGLVVVDLDGQAGLESGQSLSLASSVTVATGKGRHLYYKHPGEKVCNSVKKLPGVDIRGDGGFVLAPPSVHPNGKRYQWLSPVSVNTRMPIFPAEKLSATAAVAASGTGVSSRPTLAKPAGWIAEALKGLSNGNRNDTFASVVGRMHRDRWTPDDIRAVLLPHALCCEFPEKELETVIWSITRKPVIITGRNVPAQPGNSGEPAPKLVLRSFTNDFGEYAKRKAGNRVLEFRTGYARFDAITSGLQRGELLIVGARTETGKTNWLLGSAFGLCERSKRVLYLSTEMSFERIWDRYLAVGGNGKSHDLLVCDDFAPDVSRIRDALTDAKADVFIFDHINIVGDDNETISRFLKGLKELAREFNIPGIVSAQLNRQAEWKDQEGQRIDPGLHHLKGSGTIEETAAQVLLLNEKQDDHEAKYIQGIIAKNRYGEKGIVDFVLKKKPYRMEEM